MITKDMIENGLYCMDDINDNMDNDMSYSNLEDLLDNL